MRIAASVADVSQFGSRCANFDVATFTNDRTTLYTQPYLTEGRMDTRCDENTVVEAEDMMMCVYPEYGEFRDTMGDQEGNRGSK